MIEYTAPVVLTTGVKQGWADPEEDPALIDWKQRQSVALLPFGVVDGRPVNPVEKPDVTRGRNGLGKWGENITGDAIVLVTVNDVRHVLLIRRTDNGNLALPGGFADRNEGALTTAARECAEETGLFPASIATCTTIMPPRYQPTERASCEAWIVTRPVVFDLGRFSQLPRLRHGDDAAEARWEPAPSWDAMRIAIGDELLPGHDGMIAAALSG